MKRIPIYLDIDEIKAMLDKTANPRDHLIVHILYKTGLRCHELTSLCIEHIHFDRKEIMVIAGKGKKDRVVDMDDELKNEILQYIGDRKTGVLFLSPVRRGGGKPRQVMYAGKETTLKPRQLSDRIIGKIIKDLARKAGIVKPKPVSVHTLRHTYACHLLLSGVKIVSVQRLLGHSDMKTTAIYLEAIQTRKHIKEDMEQHPLPTIRSN